MGDFQYVMIAIGVILFLNGLYAILRPSKTNAQIAKIDELHNKDIADMSYSEFSLYILDYDLEPFINYDTFEIYSIDDRYFYYDCDPELPTGDFFEVEMIACLCYSGLNDLQIKDDVTLRRMFNCTCCGEAVEDDGIYFCWFVKVGETDDSTL